MRRAAAAFVFFLLLQTAFADHIVLKDGRTIEGTILSKGSLNVIIKDSKGVILNLKNSDIDQDKTASANQTDAAPAVSEPGKKAPRVLTNEDLAALREKYDLGQRSFGDAQKIDLGEETETQAMQADNQMADFEKEVLQSDVPVIVDFWASWCGPCRKIAPTMDAIAHDFSGRAKVYRVNIDEQESIARHFEIEAIPTLLFFKGGEQVDALVGAVPKALISEKLQAVLK